MAKTIPLQIISLLLSLLLYSSNATAEEMMLLLPSGLKAQADYRKGDGDKPAVLVLHGFLQTHHFSTVRLVADELSDAGYTVLSPTLTLNIDQRRASLNCNAIQNHSVEQASHEIGAWIDWLKKQGYARIILVGHSTGSNHLLSYLHTNRDPAVNAFIATSLGPTVSWQYPEESRRQRAQAEAAVAAGDTKLKRYSLGFCRNNYAAPAKYFLSYLHWNKEQTLLDLKTTPVPTTVVLGQTDKWLPPNWADTLEREAIRLVRIKDANHYFSGIAEFDFQAAILSLVKRVTDGGRRTP